MRADSADPRLTIAADVRRGTLRLARRLRAERPSGALSGNKISVLGFLYREGPATPGDVAAAEHQQPQSLTRVFAELELAGLITRARSERDGRQVQLSLTPAGRDVLVQDMVQRDRWLAAALAELTDAEAQLLQIAAALLDRVAAAPAVPQPAAGAA
jgi:DNA-binding MarR family transcriptional regulator